MRHRILMKGTSLLLVGVMAITTAGFNVGCFKQSFDVGAGSTTGESQDFSTWYVLWGLIPLTDVQEDAQNYASGATDYTVTSQFTPLDFLINIFTSFVTVYRKTQTVER